MLFCTQCHFICKLLITGIEILNVIKMWITFIFGGVHDLGKIPFEKVYHFVLKLQVVSLRPNQIHQINNSLKRLWSLLTAVNV